jgi:hypothetical protein
MEVLVEKVSIPGVVLASVEEAFNGGNQLVDKGKDWNDY